MKTMRDAAGNDIPVKYVKPYDKKRDKVVRGILARFLKARKALEDVVAKSVAELEELSGLKEKLGEKGNFSARSFDGLIQVSIRQQYRISLDERVVKARELMTGYVGRAIAKIAGEDARALSLIVDEAFRANPQGYLSAGRIVALLRMNIADEGWREAQGLLKESITPVKGKQYLSCEVKPDTQGEFRAVRLDIADCWPRGAK